MAYCIYFCNVLRKQISFLFRVIFSLLIGNTRDCHFSYYNMVLFGIAYYFACLSYKISTWNSEIQNNIDVSTFQPPCIPLF